MNRYAAPAVIAGALFLLTGCSTMTRPELELTDQGTLPACPSSPNCVSSDAPPADDTHHIEPLRVASDPQAGWQRLVAHLESDSSYTIVERRDDFIQAEARTRILRFVDDVLFQLRPDEGVIAMRSSSRVGYSDLGKNRRRLEAVRSAVEG